MSEIKVSVIVPIYNVEKYLPRCVDSLVNQTLKEIEIILVNDGSPDHSQEIIDAYAQQYPGKVIPLSKENGGLSDARNYGLPYAKGEYIAFLDSDDYADITFLEKMYQKAKETDAEIVVCGYYAVDETTGKYRWLQKGNEFECSLAENPTLIHKNSPYAWNKIYKRSLFERTGLRYPKGLLWEDIPTTYPLLACATKLAKVNQPLIYYILKREGSITGTYSRKMLQLFDSLALLIQRYQDLGLFEQYYDELLFINMRHIIYRFKEFYQYRDYQMKWAFVKKGFEHLDRYFPGWKQNHYYFQFNDVNKPLRQHCYRSQLFWYLYILTPNCIHRFIKKVRALAKAAKRMFSRNSLVKYAYTFYSKHHALNQQAVLFESFHGTTMSDSPFYMMRELLDSHPEMKIYFTTQHAKEHQELLDHYHLNIELVKLKSLKYAKVLATSKYLVNNVSFPPYFSRRPEQKYINTWHGTPLKTLGKNMVMGMEDMSNMQRNFLHATDMLFPNDFTMIHMMEDYNLFDLYSGQALLCGYPRNTIFLDKQKEQEMRQKFDLTDKEVFAYMPTWRGTQSSFASNNSYADDVAMILNRLDQELTDQQVLYVNLHSLVKDKIKIDHYEHIFPFPNVDNYEFLNCVDVLITDYSSVFFDFSITKKPIVLFMYDYEEYMHNRGTYFDVRELPFEKIYSLDEMAAYLKKENKVLPDSPELENYYRQFIRYDSLDATKKLNAYFFDEQKPADLQVYDYRSNAQKQHTLFFAPKINKREDCEQLKKVFDYPDPLIILVRNQFNYLLREELLDQYNLKINYVVINQNVPYTLGERIRVGLANHFSFIQADDLMERAYQNLLPGIQTKQVVYYPNPNRFTKRLALTLEKKLKQ